MAASSSAVAKWHLFSGPCGGHAHPPLSIPSLFFAVYVFLHCNCLTCSPGGVTYCNNFLRDLHNPNRLLHDWKLWSSAQFLLDHADFPLPRKSQSNPTTLKHILCILLHILQNPCNERPCVEAKQQTGSLGSWSWPCQIVNFAMLYKLEVHWCYMLVSFSATFLMKKLWFFRVPEKNWIPKMSWNTVEILKHLNLLLSSIHKIIAQIIAQVPILSTRSKVFIYQ